MSSLARLLHNLLTKLRSLYDKYVRQPLRRFHEWLNNIESQQETKVQERLTQRSLEEPPSFKQIQFTAFYPSAAAVDDWKTLLVYVFLPSAAGDIAADASLFRHEMGVHPRTSDAISQNRIAQGMQITVVPECAGVTFNPPVQSFAWFEDWHRAIFRFSAARSLADSEGNGTITIYAGPLLIGALKISLLFDEPSFSRVETYETEKGDAYQQLFVSYSHKDTTIVQACRAVYRALGMEVLIDIDKLRSGQVWNKELMSMIDNSDIFQLFWSENSANSPYVRQEWMHALKCNKGAGFIRPIYWKKPIVPPPADLAHLHFAYLPSEVFSSFRRG